MSYRLIPHRFLHFYAQKSSKFTRSITTNVGTTTSLSNHQWFFRRFLILIGLPVSTALAYRLSTKYEARRKHRILLGSIGRAVR